MKKILVVDDDQTFRELVKSAADTGRYEIATASDGVEGLACVMKSMPDVILLDIQMPRMGGVEFLEKLNGSQPGVHIPVIITSNDSSLDTISRGTELGIRGYVIKSNESLKTILTMIDNIFADKKE